MEKLIGDPLNRNMGAYGRNECAYSAGLLRRLEEHLSTKALF